MFERLNESARAAIVGAQDIAIELGSNTIDVGHLLYGLAEGREETAGKPLHDCGVTPEAVRQLLPHSRVPASEDVDAESLRAIGIDYEEVRSTVGKTFGEGALSAAADRRSEGSTRKPPFTPELKRSLEQGLRVCLELHNKIIAPGHLLLGALRLDDDFVSDVVARSNTSVAGLSSTVLAALAGASGTLG
jgi:ATP-dependent Clp protease ATP-binding subunit ClpA